MNVHGINITLLDFGSTLTYTNRRRQQLIGNFEILMYFTAFVPLLSSNNRICISPYSRKIAFNRSFYIAFSSIRGQSLCSEKASF